MIIELLLTAAISSVNPQGLSYCKQQMAEYTDEHGKPDAIKGDIEKGQEIWTYKKENDIVTFTARDSDWENGEGYCEIAHDQIDGFSNEPYGFRDLKWGTDVKTVKNLKLIKRDHHERFYKRAGDSMNVGNGTADRITYIFYKDKFSGVMIGLDGTSNCDRFRASLYKRYETPATGADEYRSTWAGLRTKMLYSSTGSACNFILISIEFINKQREDEDVEASKNAGKGF